MGLTIDTAYTHGKVVEKMVNYGFGMPTRLVADGDVARWCGRLVAHYGGTKALVVLGGLGFLVWQDIAEKRSWKKLSVYSRLVLLATAMLIVSGWALICILEWNNPETLGNLSVGSKLLGGLFQSITLRTAGFDAINQAGLTAFFLKQQKLPLKGVILNHYQPGNVLHEDNKKMCEYVTGVKVAACVQDGDKDLRISAGDLKALYEEEIK